MSPGQLKAGLGNSSKRRFIRKGKVQEEELDLCRAAGERRPAAKRDEGPGETEGVSPCAISRL